MHPSLASEWLLNEPLKVLTSEDHPYLETALGTLGRHEVAVHLSPGDPDRKVSPEFRVFLDGAEIYELGMASPAGPWFQLCRELGFAAERHWDWDPALVLFRQVIPALTQDWHEVSLPYTDQGFPEGVLCLGTLRRAWQERVSLLPHKGESEARALVAELFRLLPLRSVTFSDDPDRRVDYLGNPLDAPYLGEYLHFGPSREAGVMVCRMTLLGTGGMKWSPWLPGGAWSTEGREFRATLGPETFLRAAGLHRDLPRGFAEAFRTTLAQVCAHLEPYLEAYRQALPTGVKWHRDPRSRYLDRSIVDVRLGEETVLVLDDGSELAVREHLHVPGRFGV
jgi:hypothetical protein